MDKRQPDGVGVLVPENFLIIQFIPMAKIYPCRRSTQCARGVHACLTQQATCWVEFKKIINCTI